MTLRFHTQTAGSTLTAQQPEVNVVPYYDPGSCRGARRHTEFAHEFDGRGTRFADGKCRPYRICGTQQVIAHESGVADTVDPFAGSYAIEELTTQLERIAVDYIEKIDAMGGMLRAIETGYVQNEIQEAAYDYQRAVETQDAIVVGVNKFQADEEMSIPIQRIDERIEREQIERTRAVREKRNAPDAANALAAVEDAARGGTENLLPRILIAVEANVTVGEISTGCEPCGASTANRSPFSEFVLPAKEGNKLLTNEV